MVNTPLVSLSGTTTLLGLNKGPFGSDHTRRYPGHVYWGYQAQTSEPSFEPSYSDEEENRTRVHKRTPIRAAHPYSTTFLRVCKVWQIETSRGTRASCPGEKIGSVRTLVIAWSESNSSHHSGQA
jgi:hypothetical protein